MKVTLVYPGIATCGFNCMGKSSSMDANWTNMGLAYISSYLKKCGFETDLIDLRELKDWDEFENKVKESESPVFGIQFNTVNLNFAKKCAEIAKKYGKIVVAGGPHTTVSAEDILNTGFVDYVIVGEGEISFAELLEKIKNNKKVHEKVIVGKRVEDLNELPYPDVEIYNLKKISESIPPFPFPGQDKIIMGSRGCIFNCAFCQPTVSKIFGKLRRRSIDNIIQEIKYLKERYNTKYITFQDDTFTVDKGWVLELCKRIKEEKLNIKWSSQSRVNTFDEELAKAMSEAGCFCIFFGFESGSQKILNLMRKGITPEQSRNAAKICRKYKMLMLADYILGNPEETEEDLKQTEELIKEINPEIHSPTYFTPVPGTYLYDYCKEKDIINTKDYEDMARNPKGKKLKNVDYDLVGYYKWKISRYTPKPLTEEYYRRILLERWGNLLRLKKLKQIIKEIIKVGIYDYLPPNLKGKVFDMYTKLRR